MKQLGASAHSDKEGAAPSAPPQTPAKSAPSVRRWAILKANLAPDDFEAVVQTAARGSPNPFANVIPFPKPPGIRERLAATASHMPTLVWAMEVPRMEVEWLWQPYIPMGMLTLISGHPEAGKTWIGCAIAADVSRGRPLPGQKDGQPPGTVMLLSVEDHPGAVLRPRLEAMGADLSKVALIEEPFTLNDEGVKWLDKMMGEVKPRLVVLDPITPFTDAATDINRANQVRAIMKPLAALAKKHWAALVVTRHLRKGDGKSGGGAAILQGLGSIDYTAAARSELFVTVDRDEDPPIPIVAHAKCNLGKKGETWAFRIEDGRVRWLGTRSKSADQAAAGSGEKPEEPGASDAAKAFLREALKSGPVPAKDVLAWADDEGIKKRTLDRAKKALGVVAEQKSGGWWWALPPSDCQ